MGAVGAEATPSTICCLLAVWECDQHHHLVVWMREPGAADSLAQLTLDTVSKMHPDFHWQNWGGLKARLFNCVDVQGLCSKMESCLVNACIHCTGTVCHKNAVAIRLWSIIDVNWIQVSVPSVNWGDNESVIMHVTNILVREGLKNICIADMFAILATLAVVNNCTKNE